MNTIDDEALKMQEEFMGEKDDGQAPAPDPAVQVSPGFDWGKIKAFIFIESPDMAISYYQDSPLCFDKSEGLARMLRAVHGWLGANISRLAIIDFGVGLMQWQRVFRKPKEQPTAGEPLNILDGGVV